MARKVAGGGNVQADAAAGGVKGPPAVGSTVASAVAWQGSRLAAEVRRRRDARGLSRTKLAGLAGVHWRTIENLERGWTLPDFASMIAITHVLGIDALAGVDAGVLAVAASEFEEKLQREGMPQLVLVEVTFARRDRIGLQRLVENAPALDGDDVERLLDAAAEADGDGHVAVGLAAGGNAALHWQRPGQVALGRAVVEATMLLRRVFEDVVVLSATTQAGYDMSQVRAFVDAERNRVGGLKR